jgi:hypothetical protein
MSGAPTYVEDLPEHPMNPAIEPAEVVEVIRRMAYNRERVHKRAVERGYLTEIPPEVLRDIEVLDAAALVLEILLPHWGDHRAMIRRKRWAAKDGR